MINLHGRPISARLSVTAVIPTKDRYFTTLPLVLLSVAMQTHKPQKLIIYDDGQKIDLRNNETYRYIFQTLDANGIQWEVKFGDGRGQAHLHNRSIADSETEFIWRIDDDCVVEPYTLYRLYETITSDNKIGAVGGCVVMPGEFGTKPSILNGSLGDMWLGQNVQWYMYDKLMDVEHLYSSFIYRKSASTHGYRLDLSNAGHREETIFSHQMFRNGWRLVFNPLALTWHYRNKEGGIRTSQNEEFAHDEAVFQSIVQNDWKIENREPFIVVLDNGIGDHYAFRHVLDDLKKKHAGERIVIACCYADIFDGCDVEICSIHDAKIVLGDAGMNLRNVYIYMVDRGWKPEDGNVVDAYKSMYNL